MSVQAIASEPIKAQYMIIRGADMNDLAYAVNKRMGEGWSPLGGVVHVPTDPLHMVAEATSGKPSYPFWQAMVRT